MISVSIVSHGQRTLVAQAMQRMAECIKTEDIEVLITLNIDEPEPDWPAPYPFPITLMRNPLPKGFGANHNGAFQRAKGDWFCVMNPDILLMDDPFALLVATAERHGAALVAPCVVAPDGAQEDSIRKFPTPLGLLLKALLGRDGRYRCDPGSPPFAADWVGGMFMLFRSDTFRSVKGFDEGFFLYYEDVDICARLWKAGQRVFVCPQARVIHDAQRASHRNLRFLRWHINSLVRYLGKHWLRLPTRKERS